MWLSYHIPLTDLRVFSEVSTGKLAQPLWASDAPPSGFIRGFGAMIWRRQGDAGWMGQPQVCDAYGVLRIPPSIAIPVAGQGRLPKLLFRQVASDGGAVVHLDLGMWLNLRSVVLDADASASLIAAVLDLPVGVHIPQPHDAGAHEARLLQAGPALAEAWLWATTATADTPPGDGWVLDGMPILFVTLEKEEALELPAWVQAPTYTLDGGVHLRHFILGHRGRLLRVYVLQLGPEAPLPRAFTMEVCLKRLHIETVCARTLLHRLGEGQPTAAVLGPPAPASIGPMPRSPASDRLQRTLLDISRRLRRLDRQAHDLSPSDLPIHAGLIHPETDAEQLDSAIQRLDAALRRQDVRPNVAKSLRQTLYRLPGMLDEWRLDPQALAPMQRAAALPPDQPREEQAEDDSGSEEIDRQTTGEPETTSLQWNTGFPQDATAEKVRVLFVGVSYLLRTAIQSGQNTIGGLTLGEPLQMPDEEDLQVSDEGVQFFTVRFGVRATGAVMRPAGSELPPSSDVMSSPLHCVIGRGTPPFDVDLTATSAGPIEVELTLYVNGGAALRRSFALTAIDLAAGAPLAVSMQPTVEVGQATAETATQGSPGALLSSATVGSPGAPVTPTLTSSTPAAEASTDLAAAPEGAVGLDTTALSVESLLSLPPTAMSLKVSFRDDRYRLELVVDPAAYGPVAVSSGEEVLVNTVIAQRNELIKLSSAYRAEAAPAENWLAGLRILEPSDALLSFARIGVRLHRALFGRRDDLAVHVDLRELANTIAQMGRDAAQQPRLQIDAEFLPVPWAVLYDGPEPKTAADIDLQSFWGVRFQIHRVARVTLAQVPPNRFDAGQRRITACLNPNLDKEQKIAVLQSQRTFFLETSVQGTLIESNAALEEFLRTTVDETPCHFLYFFCHATAAQTLNRNLFRDPTSPDNAATIELDKPPISVEELRDFRITPLPARPLVFMNTCSSAQGDSVFQSLFLTHFFGTWRVSGFIGTDWTVPTVFADGFARLFLKLFLIERQPISTAFHNAAKQVLELKNPFPLIYALYVRPDYTL
jgi:hypothetical protein